MASVKAYDEVVDFLVGENPRRVAQFQPSEESRARVWELIDREKVGRLTPEETAELNTYMQIEHIMRLAKAKALLLLGQNFGTAAPADATSSAGA